MKKKIDDDLDPRIIGLMSIVIMIALATSIVVGLIKLL
jgi:hypothetical protein